MNDKIVPAISGYARHRYHSLHEGPRKSKLEHIYSCSIFMMFKYWNET